MAFSSGLQFFPPLHVVGLLFHKHIRQSQVKYKAWSSAAAYFRLLLIRSQAKKWTQWIQITQSSFYVARCQVNRKNTSITCFSCSAHLCVMSATQLNWISMSGSFNSSIFLYNEMPNCPCLMLSTHSRRRCTSSVAGITKKLQVAMVLQTEI